MYIKNKYLGKVKTCSNTFLASPGGANIVNSTTVLSPGKTYRIATVLGNPYISHTTLAMTNGSANKAIYLPKGFTSPYVFTAHTTYLQTMGTVGNELLQLTEFED